MTTNRIAEYSAAVLSVIDERDRFKAVNAELLAALEKTYALPFRPSNNGEQWDEGFERGWNTALNQVYEIARAALAKAKQS